MEQSILCLAVGIIGGVFGGLLYHLASEYFETKISETESKPEDLGNEEQSLLSQYRYAIVRIYYGKDDRGLTTITLKPMTLCEDEENAVQGAKKQREYEKQVALSNPTSEISNYWKANNVRAIKIYEVD